MTTQNFMTNRNTPENCMANATNPLASVKDVFYTINDSCKEFVKKIGHQI
jgi:hypothetical protein